MNLFLREQIFFRKSEGVVISRNGTSVGTVPNNLCRAAVFLIQTNVSLYLRLRLVRYSYLSACLSVYLSF